jgi:hypothetical protein
MNDDAIHYWWTAELITQTLLIVSCELWQKNGCFIHVAVGNVVVIITFVVIHLVV